jgi:hypothetical protein
MEINTRVKRRSVLRCERSILPDCFYTRGVGAKSSLPRFARLAQFLTLGVPFSNWLARALLE